jgi:hypothetical protein
MPLVLSPGEESSLTAFVEGCGTLVSAAGTGLYKEAGVLDPSRGSRSTLPKIRARPPYWSSPSRVQADSSTGSENRRP